MKFKNVIALLLLICMLLPIGTNSFIVHASSVFDDYSLRWRFDGNMKNDGNINNFRDDYSPTILQYDSTTHREGTHAACFNGATYLYSWNSLDPINGNSSLETGSEITISTLVKVSSEDRLQAIWCFSQDWLNLRYKADTKKFQIGLWQEDYTSLESAEKINLNEWYLVTYVIDGNRMELYINGVLSNSTTLPFEFNGNEYPSARWYLGIDYFANNAFEGYLDDMIVYPRALTSAEILDMYIFYFPQHTVSFEVYGGTLIDNKNVVHGGKVTKPEDPTKAGYTFGGWYTDSSYTTTFDFDNTTITSNTVIYAKWIRQDSITMTASPSTVEVTADFNQIFTLSINNDTVISSVYNSDLTLGGVFRNLSISRVDNTSTTVTVTVYGDLSSSGVGIITLNENKLQKGRSPLSADIIVTSKPTYTVTFNSNGGTSVAPITAEYSTTIKQPPNPRREGYVFRGWFKDEALTIAFDFNNPITENMVLFAKWERVTIDYDDEDDDDTVPSVPGTGGSSSGGSQVDRWRVDTDDTNNMPILATQTLTNQADQKGNLTITITKEMVEEGIGVAKKKWSDSENKGISIAFNNISDDEKSFTASIEATALDDLVSQEVKSLTLQCGIYNIILEEEAIKSLDAQSSGNITITVTPYEVSGTASSVIGGRPVFDITFKDNEGREISSFGSGTITRGIRYTPAADENTDNLFIIKVTDNGIEWIVTSSYEKGWMMWRGNSNSVYGVGYKTTAFFTDTENHWAKDNIDFVVRRGLISGITATTFEPDRLITRADFLMALGKLSGADVSVYKTSSFIDVANDSNAMPYIEWAYKSGIVSGTGNNKFSPNDEITREQMAVMMQKYAKVIGYTIPVSRQYDVFTDDSKISSWAKDAVKAITQAEIVNGKSGGNFDPQGNATRGEAATILQRFVKFVID